MLDYLGISPDIPLPNLWSNCYLCSCCILSELHSTLRLHSMVWYAGFKAYLQYTWTRFKPPPTPPLPCALYIVFSRSRENKGLAETSSFFCCYLMHLSLLSSLVTLTMDPHSSVCLAHSNPNMAGTACLFSLAGVQCLSVVLRTFHLRRVF